MLVKTNIALICILGMVCGFLFSRAMLSICTILFGVNALWDIHPRQWLKNKWWLLGVIWVAMYAITYFWSDDKGNWDTRWQVKLPILLLPLSFSFLPRFTPKQIQLFTLAFATLLIASVFYSLYFFLKDPAYYINQYRYSHMLPTPAKQDYIRFSTTIVLFMIWCIYVWPRLYDKAVKWIIGLTIGLLVLYIHVLASKTGLVAFYLFLIGYAVYLLFGKRRVWGLLIILAIPTLFMLATRFIPTFRERREYAHFSYIMLKIGDNSGNYGDIARLKSYELAAKIIKEHPWTGVGTGDMLTEMNKAYDKWYPEFPEHGRLLPHNQFLTVALGCGIPAMIVFAIWVFMPLASIRKNRRSFFFFMVWLILLLQLMIEPALEVQFGVFVFLLFLLLLMHELPHSGEAAPALQKTAA